VHAKRSWVRGYFGDIVRLRKVATGLPRHVSNEFNDRWRGKPVATPFFISLLNVSRVQALRGAVLVLSVALTFRSARWVLPT